MRSAAPRPVGLRLIAALKFVKAAILLAAGIGALRLLSPEQVAWVQDWLEGVSLDQFAAGALLFAALFVVEGVGLALARRWAEYLTVVVTISYLPVEVFAAWHRWTLLRSGTIVLNIVVVAYLVVQLRRPTPELVQGPRHSGRVFTPWRAAVARRKLVDVEEGLSDDDDDDRALVDPAGTGSRRA